MTQNLNTIFGNCVKIYYILFKGHRTKSNSNDFKKRPLIIIYYNVDFVNDAKGTNYVRNRIIKLAQKFKNENLLLSFAISSTSEFESELIESYGFTVDTFIGKYIVGLGANEEKYKFEGVAYSIENLESFARDLLAGSLKKYLKSQPVPDYANSNEYVKQLVAENFDQIVNDEGRDVLIEFYAPW